MSKFVRGLTACHTIEEVDKLLRVKTQRWRGKPLIPQDAEDVGEGSEAEDVISDGGYDGLVLLAEHVV